MMLHTMSYAGAARTRQGMMPWTSFYNKNKGGSGVHPKRGHGAVAPFMGLLAALLLAANSAQATSLCNVSITTAQTASIQTAVAGFGKPQALSIQAKFAYVASAATSADVYVQTTIDGINWVDIANFHYTTSSALQLVNVSGMTPVTVPANFTDGSIAANTVLQGVLGDQFRCKITSVGTYGAGTTMAIDIKAR